MRHAESNVITTNVDRYLDLPTVNDDLESLMFAIAFDAQLSLRNPQDPTLLDVAEAVARARGIMFDRIHARAILEAESFFAERALDDLHRDTILQS